MEAKEHGEELEVGLEAVEEDCITHTSKPHTLLKPIHQCMLLCHHFSFDPSFGSSPTDSSHHMLQLPLVAPRPLHMP